MSDAVRVVHMGELERIEVAGVVYMPIRRRLGVRAFGINAYTAASAGDQVIERHNEGGAGAGAHEELYLVISGRAEFTVAGEAVDAPAGTLVFVPDLASERAAIAREPDTTVLVIGAPAAAPLPTSPFEYWFAAEPAYRSGDYDGAIAIASEGLREWPDHPVINYQLACYHALAGRRAEALAHLATAVAGEPRTAGWAAGDADFDSIRDDPVFPPPP
ncbi:MAG TPA: tetratricopeptide repeat protein [Gaiellales bacterium]